MRLIDVDEHFRINKIFYDADIEMPLHRIKVVLEYAPTVEAIPIEFIEEYISYQDAEEQRVLRMMWHAWELREEEK